MVRCRYSGVLYARVPVRRLGSAAIDLCWVAAGRFDGFFEHSLSPLGHSRRIPDRGRGRRKVTDMEGGNVFPYQESW